MKLMNNNLKDDAIQADIPIQQIFQKLNTKIVNQF